MWSVVNEKHAINLNSKQIHACIHLKARHSCSELNIVGCEIVF